MVLKIAPKCSMPTEESYQPFKQDLNQPLHESLPKRKKTLKLLKNQTSKRDEQQHQPRKPLAPVTNKNPPMTQTLPYKKPNRVIQQSTTLLPVQSQMKISTSQSVTRISEKPPIAHVPIAVNTTTPAKKPQHLNTTLCKQLADKSMARFQCQFCQKSYANRGGLFKHVKKNHSEQATTSRFGDIKCHEEKCIFKCRYLQELRDHLTLHHSFPMESETITFATIEGEHNTRYAICLNDSTSMHFLQTFTYGKRNSKNKPIAGTCKTVGKSTLQNILLLQ